MGEPAEVGVEGSPRRKQDVVSMIDYLRETIAQMDRVFAGAFADWQSGRKELAVRLAALEAAEDPLVAEAVADFEVRTSEDRPYEDAQDAADVLSEAHRRYGT